MFVFFKSAIADLDGPLKRMFWQAAALATAIIPLWAIFRRYPQNRHLLLQSGTNDEPMEVKKTRRERRVENKAELRAREKELREQQKAVKRARRRADADAAYASLQALLLDGSSGRSLVTFAAIDVEAWEQGHDKVTEIGLAVVQLSRRTSATPECPALWCDFRHRHLLMKEHLSMRNGRFVEDNKDSFLFGDSELMCLDDASRELSVELRNIDFIVGQAPHGDLKWLRSIGVTGVGVDGDDNVVFDTQLLAVANARPDVDVLNVSSLKALADLHALAPCHLHNAGNDAAFTAQVFLSQFGIAFALPAHTPSRHLAAFDFQAALAEANVAAPAAESERLAREEGLRDEVRQFAEEVQSASVDNPDADLVRRFPSGLSSADRRVVHEAAENLGLGSRSAKGSDGKKSVSIFPFGSEREKSSAAQSSGQWQRRHARRRSTPKMKSGPPQSNL